MITDEHDAFNALIQSLRQAAEAAEAMSRFRPDQPWSLMAKTYRVCAASAYKLAEESLSKVVKS